MKILFLSNFFNHHQKPLADYLYSVLMDDYVFVETMDHFPEEQLNLGYNSYDVPYTVRYRDQKAFVDRMILEADVVICGQAPVGMIKDRLKTGKLTFRCSESRYKKLNRFLKWPIYTYESYWFNKCYLLCASAFAPIDYYLSGMSPEKCYKWGYFTEVKKYESVVDLMRMKRAKHPQSVSILWAGRLLGWKHPERALYVAENLKNKGYSFTLEIIGTGKLQSKLARLISEKGLDDCVKLLGSMPHVEVRKKMEESDVFLFTSGRGEGWGAVLNESMNSGCAVVVDGNIGSAPYLIDNGVNGLIYSGEDNSDLLKKVERLVQDRTMTVSLGRKAYETILNIWNAEVAGKNLMALCDALLTNNVVPIMNGPCEHAPLMLRTWKGIIDTL